jgi:restriction system protein
MTIPVLVAIIIAVLVVVLFRELLTKFLPSKRHRKNIGKARKVLNDLRGRRLSEAEKIPVVLGTLRKVDPFVLEELILTCCQERGWKIIRNKRYTGDGGIDGKVIVGKQLLLIQVKRYRDHINPHHVREFQRVVGREGAAGGLFIHTGKTGKQSKAVVKDSVVSIVSGRKLVDFVLGQKISVRKE